MKNKEVLINSCYGGYSLSAKAMARLAELNGKTAYFFRISLSAQNKYEPISQAEAQEDCFFSAFSIPNPAEFLVGKKPWLEMDAKERTAFNAKYRDISLSSRPEPRDCKNLIQVIKELGEEANGAHANLKIVEIPANVDWQIAEYGGFEHVEEVHQAWG